MFDESRIPERVALDASILIPALQDSRAKEHHKLACELFEFVVTRRHLYIATPALAECFLGGGEGLFGLPRVTFVDFNVVAAKKMVDILGPRASERPEGTSRKIAKFDAMIVSAYRFNGRVEMFFTNDGPQRGLAEKIGLDTATIESVLERQQALPLDIKPPRPR